MVNGTLAHKIPQGNTLLKASYILMIDDTEVSIVSNKRLCQKVKD